MTRSDSRNEESARSEALGLEAFQLLEKHIDPLEPGCTLELPDVNRTAEDFGLLAELEAQLSGLSFLEKALSPRLREKSVDRPAQRRIAIPEMLSGWVTITCWARSAGGPWGWCTGLSIRISTGRSR